MIRRRDAGAAPAASAPHATITRRRCCPMARCWWREDTMSVVVLSSAELYDPATGSWSGDRQPGHRTLPFTRRRCCPMARCWWRGDVQWLQVLRAARSCMIRRLGRGRRPAASAPHATDHTATLLPTARCWWRGDAIAVRDLSSAELYDPATGRWTATGSLGTARAITRRRCCPMARCWWRAETMVSP